MERPGYPKKMREFRQRFSTPEACRAYLVQCRWPYGFVCPTCSGKKAWLNQNR
ncbi:MAG: transposase, partial [Nitrospirota bacterium]